jgi:hypothetical protein
VSLRHIWKNRYKKKRFLFLKNARHALFFFRVPPKKTQFLKPNKGF